MLVVGSEGPRFLLFHASKLCQYKGWEVKWSITKSRTWNCMNCTKMQWKLCIPYEHMTQILKFLNFQQLLKCISIMFVGSNFNICRLDHHLLLSPSSKGNPQPDHMLDISVIKSTPETFGCNLFITTAFGDLVSIPCTKQRGTRQEVMVTPHASGYRNVTGLLGRQPLLSVLPLLQLG